MSAHSDFANLGFRTINSSATVDDNQFGPFIEFPGKVTFDFTLLFEETILSILPSALFLLLVPPRILRLCRTPRKVTGSYLQTVKIVGLQIPHSKRNTDRIQTLLAIFGVLQIVNIVEVSRSSLRTRASLPAALLALAATLGLGVLSYAEHTRNIRPSSIINAYLLFTLPFDAAQLRTKWLRGDDVAASGVSTSVLAIKFLVLISEAAEKRSILSTPYADPSPEATSGLYSRGLFWWLNSLFRLGFRNIVREDDLFSVDRDLQSKALGARFDRYWVNRISLFLPPFLSNS
jgi:ATP-binding cassette, subfamily C (CFTR/MRP), member 1